MADALSLLSEAGIGTTILSLLIFIASIVAFPFVTKLVDSFLGRSARNVDETKREYIKVALIAFYTFLVLVILLALMGTKSTPSMMIFILVALLVSTCCKSVVENLAAGVTLRGKKLYNVGSYISSNGISGTVVKFGVLDTVIRTDSGPYATVPNTKLSSATITVSECDTPFRVKISIPVSILADHDTVCSILTEVAKNTEHVVPDKPVVVGVNSFYKGLPQYDCNIWFESSYFEKASYAFTRDALKSLNDAGIPLK